MSSANPQSLAGRVGICILALATALYLLASIREIDRDLKQDSNWQTYFTKDAMHYYVIAQAFASGDFSMSYEKGWPYRQPLFSLLVAGVMKTTNDNLFAIRLVNVGVTIVTAISLFLILRGLLFESASAAIIATLFVLNPFVYDQSVRGLNSEPLHLLLLVCIIACFLGYVGVRRWVYLSLLALSLGLDYLDRVNGLFLSFSALAAITCFEFGQYFFGSERPSIRKLRRHAVTPTRPRGRGADLSDEASGVSDDRAKSDTQYSVTWWHCALAALVLVVITAPSWFSHLYYFGNPFYHGAIQNFLWGNSYLESMDSPRLLTASDYFASHSLLDACQRFLLGCWKVFFIIPMDRERLPVLYLAALAGIWIAWRQRRTPYFWLLLFYLLQMLPLAWTQPVNTTPRIPYAATQPFELFFAAIFLHAVMAERRVRTVALSKNDAPAITGQQTSLTQPNSLATARRREPEVGTDFRHNSRD